MTHSLMIDEKQILQAGILAQAAADQKRGAAMQDADCADRALRAHAAFRPLLDLRTLAECMHCP